ncbi:Helix-turn-helix domain-containing protein [Paraburkholderia tuberum]|uniref:Helix-turn-helix domain-containing protein n=1 Tax=Paraburkholderia tuberum TaxID=157910 RepID=A0A1H1JKF9_9BURK|nr:Helix-turn-helix domain-containing protein [Paraburkholderia tuberum]
MKKNYKHLSAEERAAIMIEHRKGDSIRTIAGLLGRSASTVSRELARNCSVDAPRYCATQAASAYRLRRRRCVRPRELIEGSALYRHVHDHLVYWRWSPQQIAAKLRAMYPDDPSQHVSHETVYAAIYTYARGSLKPAMIAALRQEKPARGNRRTTLAGGSYVPEDLRIQYRPEQIEQRLSRDVFSYVFMHYRDYGSMRETHGAYTIDEIASDALALADGLGFHTFSLIGHSMGGMAIERIATLAPGACQGTCRLSHAAKGCLSVACEAIVTTDSRSGLRVTAPIGVQSRVQPDQRAGLRSRAWTYTS